MKIRVTEIECNADELRQSNTLADSFVNLLRGCFAGTVNRTTDDQDKEDEDDE